MGPRREQGSAGGLWETEEAEPVLPEGCRRLPVAPVVSEETDSRQAWGAGLGSSSGQGQDWVG